MFASVLDTVSENVQGVANDLGETLSPISGWLLPALMVLALAFIVALMLMLYAVNRENTRLRKLHADDLGEVQNLLNTWQWGKFICNDQPGCPTEINYPLALLRNRNRIRNFIEEQYRKHGFPGEMEADQATRWGPPASYEKPATAWKQVA